MVLGGNFLRLIRHAGLPGGKFAATVSTSRGTAAIPDYRDPWTAPTGLTGNML
jgi:hypothetical protein